MSSPEPRPAAPLPTFLTAAEVAPILRMTPYQVADLCKNDKIRATKPGRSWLIEVDAVHEYLRRSANDYQAAS